MQISPIIFKIDYNPKSLDVNDLVAGNYIELLSFFALDDLKLTLDCIKLSGVYYLHIIL